MPILDLPDHSPQIAFCVTVMAAAYPDEPQHHLEFLNATLGVFDDRMIKSGLVDPAEDWQSHSELAQAMAAMPLRLKMKLARKDICMHRKKINLSITLAGQKVGIKEVDDGIWLVSFLAYDLGYIELG